jgi:thiosulfate/3-mercaptopyruvate sulfurtransferase
MPSEVGGLDDVTMYDGSMAAWIRDDSRPVHLAGRGVLTVGELVD